MTMNAVTEAGLGAVSHLQGRTARFDVMHLFAPARFGGLESVVHALATGQLERGHSVSIVALLETGIAEPPVVANLREAGATVLTPTFPARSFRMQRRALLELLTRHRPQVLHSHGYLPDVLSASISRRSQVCRITTVHGFAGGGWRNRTYEWMQRKSYRRLDAVVAVSAKLARELGEDGVPRNVIHPLPNAWSPPVMLLNRQQAQKALGLSTGKFNVAWIGRISQEKGLDVMIDALPELADLPVHLTVIGDGRQREVLENRAILDGVDSRITWHGELPDASCVMPGFDLLVISSRTEGTPIVLLEAMNAGLPVVATAVGGIPDAISPTEGLLVSPESPSSLAIAIRGVHANREAAFNRADLARARVERDFALSPWLDSYDAIYERARSARHA
jgi:glycosyltransferase involved in cell wall biosynthesis